MSKKLAKKQGAVLRHEALEPRVLFSGDVVPGLDTPAVQEQVVVEDAADEVKIDHETKAEAADQAVQESRWERVFVNDNVTDHDQRIAETATSHNIAIRATSSDTSFSTFTLAISVNSVDALDVDAVADTNAAVNEVAEDAAVGTEVGVTAFAQDDDVTNTVTYSLSDDAGGRFAIDANTGVITVNGALDYETATSHSVTVLATSTDGSTSSRVFTINVIDVNEGAIGPVIDTDATADSVDEDAAIGTTVGITANAVDPDGTDTVTYSLDDDAGGLFTIDAATGVVTVAAALDAETATSHNITIRATSSDTSFSTATFTITVRDVAEFDNDTAIDTGPVLNDSDTEETDGSNNETQSPEPPGTDQNIEDEATTIVFDDSNTMDVDLVLINSQDSEQDQEIIYVIDKNDVEAQSEARKEQSDFIYFSNEFFSDMAAKDYLAFGNWSEEKDVDIGGPIDFSTIDFRNNQLTQVIEKGGYDQIREEIDEAFSSEQESRAIQTKIVTASVTAFVVGIVSYLLRAGSIVASMMSTIPLWRGIDPMVIFSGHEKKKAEEISNKEESNPETLFDGDAE